MRTYACSFISGLQRVVADALTQACSDAEVRHLLDGLVVFDSGARVEALKRLRFVNNLFAVIEEFDRGPIESMMRSVVDDPASVPLRRPSGKRPARTFRVIASRENQFVSVDRDLLRDVEQLIAKRTGLRVGRSKPDVEFWFLHRREGVGLFLRRLTKHASFDQMLERGKLRSDLCHAMCLVSEPSDGDVFLDPFCGSGAIPLERARSFPFRLVFATDSDAAKITALRRKVKATRRKQIIRSFIARSADALDMQKFEDGFVSKLVTDPPWGLFEDIGTDIREFYSKMLREFRRVLAAGGIMVILTARKEEFEEATAALAGRVELAERHDILVSGKKAGVYKLVKLA